MQTSQGTCFFSLPLRNCLGILNYAVSIARILYLGGAKRVSRLVAITDQAPADTSWRVRSGCVVALSPVCGRGHIPDTGILVKDIC